MKFSVITYNQSFAVEIEPSNKKTNYPNMPEGGYDFREEMIFDSLPAVRSYLRNIWLNGKRLTESERYWIREEIRELSLESLVDELLKSKKYSEERLNEKIKLLSEILDPAKNKKEGVLS